MACADDVIPSAPDLVEEIDPASFGLPDSWTATVWTDGVVFTHEGVDYTGVMEFPDYPGEFYLVEFDEDQCVGDLIGPFPNAATAVALLELTKT